MKSLFFAALIFLSLILSQVGESYGASPAAQPAAENQSTTAAETAAAKTADKDSLFKSEDDKVFYAIGVQLIGNFKRQGIDIDLDMVTQGMRDALSGKPLPLDDSELRKLIMTYQEKAVINMGKTRRAEAEANKKNGFAFLEENKMKKGVVTMESGIQITRLKEGEGARPTQSDTVECTYKGMLIDGTVIARSSEDGKPAQFKVSSMLPGLQEALKLMPVGASWKVVIPSHLAYGPRGGGNTVGPNAVLVYELELHRIIK